MIIKEISTKGKDVANIGYASEHLTQSFINCYRDHLKLGKKHPAALTAMQRERVLQSSYALSAVRCIDIDTFKAVHDDAKETAKEIVSYVDHKFQTKITNCHHTGKNVAIIKDLTGKESNADLVIEHAYTDYLGSSLKYAFSKGRTGKVQKVFSPSVTNFVSWIESLEKKATGKSKLFATISKLSQQSLEQQTGILRYHHKILMKLNNKKLTYNNHSKTTHRDVSYEPIYNGKKMVGGILSHGAVSYIRDVTDYGKKEHELSSVYNDMNQINLDYKRLIAEQLAKACKKILSTNDLSEEFLRGCVKLTRDWLPTVSVVTDRTKTGTKVSIYDISESVKQFLKNTVKLSVKYSNDTSRFYVGPLQFYVDVRPGFKSPMTRTINIYLDTEKLHGR